ncbi:cholinesterase 2-like [Branchiostoma lanceolatum]|uniref:cholinesterase 2-like n=1 Tax=Branchiostoma lanceolatum TaxID=7740 RepID=UPI0034539DA9
MMLQVLIAILLVPALFHLPEGVTAADVTAPAGRVSGLELDVLGTKVNAFLGIPFARPPVGESRFKHAEALPPWDGTYNATRKPQACLQILYADDYSGLWALNTTTSEDCLFLSVWQPNPAPTGAAVMVWIYGGGFQTGASTCPVYDGRYLAATEGVVVVGLQYRVSTLGFLYAGTDDAPANVGFTDQALALTWVKNNIVAFGGDPAKVTLFGESAGGTSVAFHLLSPGSWDLFNRAILQSGTATQTWGLDTREAAYEKTLAIAKAVGCPTDQGRDKMIECFRGKDGQELVSSSALGYTSFYPVEDGTVIPENPFVSYEKGAFKKADILLGSNENEGTYFFVESEAPGFSADTESLITKQQYLEGIPYMVAEINDFAVDAAAFKYTDWENLDKATMYRDAFDSLYSDYYYFCPDVRTGRGHVREGATAYMYRFAHRASVSPFAAWMGVVHGEELSFVFGLPLDPAFGFNQAERNLTRRVMRHWANFARTGNPNSNNEAVWSPFSLTGGRYLVLDTGEPRMVRGPSTEDCAFWDTYVTPLMNKTDALKNELKSCTSGASGQHLTEMIAVVCSLVSMRIFLPG